MTTVLLTIPRVHATRGDLMSPPDLYVTLQQGDIFIRTGVQQDATTCAIPGTFIFDEQGPVDVKIFDADLIGSDDLIHQTSIPLSEVGVHEDECVSCVVRHVQVVPAGTTQRVRELTARIQGLF